MKYRYQKRNMSHIPESRNLLKASDEKLISEPDESLLVIYKIKYPIQNVYSTFLTLEPWDFLLPRTAKCGHFDPTYFYELNDF